MRFKIILTSLLIFCSCHLKANEPVPLGNWRVHLPYYNVNTICETQNLIFCAAEHGMFTFNKADGQTERLSPANGFSAYKTQAMAYD
jgi:hypothetical protein